MLRLRSAWIQKSELPHLFGKRQAKGVKGAYAWSDKATVPRVTDAEASASPKRNEQPDAVAVSPRESGETATHDEKEWPAVGGAEAARADDTAGAETETRWWLQVSANFTRAFRTVHDPDLNQLFVRAADK